MHKAVPIFALVALLAGCGGDKQDPAPTPVATATATATGDGGRRTIRSRATRRACASYYAGADPSAVDDPNADAEVALLPAAASRRGQARRHDHPDRREHRRASPRSTVTGVETVEVDGKEYTAVELELDNDVGGITVLDSELKSATLTYPDGKVQPVAKRGVKAPLLELVRRDRAHRRRRQARRAACSSPPADGPPERFQLALETVPADAGGIWNLG